MPSDFRADAVSPKGAQGVMQLMPVTAVAYRVDDPHKGIPPYAETKAYVEKVEALAALYQPALLTRKSAGGRKSSSLR